MLASSGIGLTYVDDEWKFSSDWAIPEIGLPALPRFIVDKILYRLVKGQPLVVGHSEALIAQP